MLSGEGNGSRTKPASVFFPGIDFREGLPAGSIDQRVGPAIPARRPFGPCDYGLFRRFLPAAGPLVRRGPPVNLKTSFANDNTRLCNTLTKNV